MANSRDELLHRQWEADLLEEQRLAAELRREILRRKLQHVIPRIYNGGEGDVVGALLDKLEELETIRKGHSPHKPEPAQDEEEDDAPPSEGEKARLRALADWIRQETPDGQRLHHYLEVVQAVEGLAVDPERPLSTTGAVAVPLVHSQAHLFHNFPFGFLWCVRCGAVWRRGENHRYFHPGIGEVSELPTCPGPRGPEENTDP